MPTSSPNASQRASSERTANVLPTDQPTAQLVDPPMEELVEQSMEEPMQEPMEQPAEAPGGSPSYQWLDVPFFAPATPEVALAGQIAPEQMASIKSAGFASVINNRPDFEGGPQQPSSEAMRRAAEASGLRYVHQPVVSSSMTRADAERFHQLLGELPKPVLAFCRTGTRCAHLLRG